MIGVVQRVSEASVEVAGDIVGRIGHGLLALVSVETGDTEKDILWTANKIVGLRVFRNAEKYFDIDVKEAGGGVLLVSNFTVAAETRAGRRPSFIAAAGGEEALMKFNRLVALTTAAGIPVATGVFGADMRVQLVNDGPATFIINSRATGPG